MKDPNIKGYTRVTKSKAERLYDEGEAIYIVPSETLPTMTGWNKAFEKKRMFDKSFHRLTKELEFVCNDFDGKYLAFYIKSDIND